MTSRAVTSATMSIAGTLMMAVTCGKVAIVDLVLDQEPSGRRSSIDQPCAHVELVGDRVGDLDHHRARATLSELRRGCRCPRSRRKLAT